MKKGCIIAIVVVLVLGLIAVGAIVWLGGKGIGKLKEAGSAGMVFAVEKAIEEYQKANPDAQVAPTNAAWAEVLQGYESATGTDVSGFIKDGKLVDINQNELGIAAEADGSIKVTSPGEDGQLGTADDVTSEMFEKLEAMGKAAESAEQ